MLQLLRVRSLHNGRRLISVFGEIGGIRMASNHRGLESKVVKVEDLAEGKWMTFQNYHWTDHTGKNRVWEVVSRKKTGDVKQDSVAVVAKVSRAGHSSAIVLIKQFRPPLRSYTIELPAGLIDGGESVMSAALRELKEETGLTGYTTGGFEDGGRPVALDPGISSSTISIVTVQVDGDSAENRDVSSVCGVDGECTEVFFVPLSDLSQRLADFSADGCIIDSRVEAMALGFNISSG